MRTRHDGQCAPSGIEVLAAPDDRYTMAKAYRSPTAQGANVTPGSKHFPNEPAAAMGPRSVVTGRGGQVIAYEPTVPVGRIAFGGDRGVAQVAVSADSRRS